MPFTFRGGSLIPVSLVGWDANLKDETSARASWLGWFRSFRSRRIWRRCSCCSCCVLPWEKLPPIVHVEERRELCLREGRLPGRPPPPPQMSLEGVWCIKINVASCCTCGINRGSEEGVRVLYLTPHALLMWGPKRRLSWDAAVVVLLV